MTRVEHEIEERRWLAGKASSLMSDDDSHPLQQQYKESVADVYEDVFKHSYGANLPTKHEEMVDEVLDVLVTQRFSIRRTLDHYKPSR
ncbi:hypothetical protein R6242_21520 [Iodobacter sp. CM08]|uniref:hypothetical protein n=1 Tax=Iodobacter sp. CM08 TaxID=3085902 RepID=UPI002980E7B6|nr:hypothetical protein [Iodobacter sp. CM08]MDW5419157.1 hypothetical protein [Iodobacter sp. CM08]